MAMMTMKAMIMMVIMTTTTMMIIMTMMSNTGNDNDETMRHRCLIKVHVSTSLTIQLLR